MANLRGNNVRFFANSINESGNNKSSNTMAERHTPFGLKLQEKMSTPDTIGCCSTHISPTLTPSGTDSGVDFDA